MFAAEIGFTPSLQTFGSADKDQRRQKSIILEQLF
jgi:hypothetical protein